MPLQVGTSGFADYCLVAEVHLTIRSFSDSELPLLNAFSVLFVAVDVGNFE
jgi:hypothetical protein